MWTKDTNSKLIRNLLDTVQQFSRGQLSREFLLKEIAQFLRISIDCRESLKSLCALWFSALQRTFAVSLKLGLFFLYACLCYLAKRVVDYIYKKSVWPVRKLIVQRKVQRLTATLKTDKNKINILCAVPAMSMGGAQKVVLSIAEGLKTEGDICFHLIATKKADQHLKKAFAEFFDNIIVIDRLPDEDLYQYYYTKAIEALGIDILLISHPVITYKFIADLKERYKKLKIVDILHLERVGGTKDELSWLVPHIDRRVCISRHLCEYMAARYTALGMDSQYAGRLATVYNGIDLNHYSNNASLKGRFRSSHKLADNVRLISFIARFGVEKDPLLFVEIARGLLKNPPPVPVKFVMAGDGPLFSKVQDKIHEYGLTDDIILPGMLNNSQELLADSHLFVLTSNHEGIPLTVMEALAMGVPVVSTVVGAVNEVLQDGVNGYLIAPAADIKDKFISKIWNTLTDDALYRSLSGNARSSIPRDFYLETMARRYKQVFMEVLDSERNEKIYESR